MHVCGEMKKDMIDIQSCVMNDQSREISTETFAMHLEQQGLVPSNLESFKILIRNTNLVLDGQYSSGLQHLHNNDCVRKDVTQVRVAS